MEGFRLENIPVPEEALLPAEKVPQDAEVREMSGETVDQVADLILATALKTENGHEFIVQTLAEIEKYAQGNHDENRRALFPYWSNEKIQELHAAVLKKMGEGLMAGK